MESGWCSKDRRWTFLGPISPHPNPLPKGEGAAFADLRCTRTLRIQKAPAARFPSPQGRGIKGEGKGNLQITTRIKPFFILLLSLLVPPVAAGVPEGWSTNLAGVLSVAQTNRQPVLVYFTADWCGPCKMMGRTTLKGAGVLRRLERFQCAGLDIDNQKAAARDYGVNAVPTFLVLDGAGDEVDRTSGFMEASLFQAWLVSALDKHLVALQRQEKFRQQQERVRRDLQDADSGKKAAALKALFDLCARREQSHHQFALAELKALAAREPALLLPGLNHPSLAVRLHLTNLLREKWGDDFQFDPWEPKAIRARAAEALQKNSD